MAFEYLQACTFHNSGQPESVLNSSHRKKSDSQCLKGTFCVSDSACCLHWTLSNHRIEITEWVGLEGSSESSSSNASAMGWGTFH